MTSGIARLGEMKQAGEKIACLTAYDATMAALLHAAGADALLVGDSLGMVVQGQSSTRSVTLDDMVYHAANVARGAPNALRIVDLPYQSYTTAVQAAESTRRLVEEGGAHLVKPEGGGEIAAIVARLVKSGYPVCGHLGLLPQSVASPDGYRVQGRSPDDADRIVRDALALQEAGASMLVIECVPASLGRRITESVSIPTIGIGAGQDTDGQVLVVYDMLGMTSGRLPRFVKNFMQGHASIADAVAAYVGAVKSGQFPGRAHRYND